MRRLSLHFTHLTTAKGTYGTLVDTECRYSTGGKSSVAFQSLDKSAPFEYYVPFWAPHNKKNSTIFEKRTKKSN